MEVWEKHWTPKLGKCSPFNPHYRSLKSVYKSQSLNVPTLLLFSFPFNLYLQARDDWLNEALINTGEARLPERRERLRGACWRHLGKRSPSIFLHLVSRGTERYGGPRTTVWAARASHLGVGCPKNPSAQRPAPSELFSILPLPLVSLFFSFSVFFFFITINDSGWPSCDSCLI